MPMPLGYVIFQKLCPGPFPSVSYSFPEPLTRPQCCLYNLLEGQPVNSWPLGGKYCIISNPSRYSGLHLPCFLQHVYQQCLSVNLLGWMTGPQSLLEVHHVGGIPSRENGLPGIMFALWELALQAVWAKTLTILLLKLQTYPWIKSPLHFYGTSGLLPRIDLFLSHLLTLTTRTLPPCRQHCPTLLIIKILLVPVTEPDNPLLCHYFSYHLK